MHHGFVANCCRLLLRGRFPTLSKIYKLVGLPIFFVGTNTDHNFHRWTRTARHQNRRTRDKQSIDDFVFSRCDVLGPGRWDDRLGFLFTSNYDFTSCRGHLLRRLVFSVQGIRFYRQKRNELLSGLPDTSWTHFQLSYFGAFCVWENWNSVHIQRL